MRRLILCSIVTVAGVLVAAPASADIVYVFDNQTTTIGAGLDGQSTGFFTQSGASGTATLTATSSTSDLFNATASEFGINQSASGDDTDGFDFTQSGGPGVAEGLILSFDTNVLLDTIDVSSFSADSDLIEVVVGGTTVATVDSTGTTSLDSFAVSAGTDVLINTTAGAYGNGWSLDSFGVTVVAVPEPGAVTLLGLFSLGAIARRRRI